MWKIIKEFPNYSVSKKGSIKNNITNKVLKPLFRDGYSYVNLYKKQKSYSRYIHRLVASSFLKKNVNKRYVNHKDFNRSNNKLINLEWVTHKENINHAKLNNRLNSPKGERAGTSKLKIYDIKIIKYLYRYGLTQKQIGSIFKVYASTISDVINNISWRN